MTSPHQAGPGAGADAPRLSARAVVKRYGATAALRGVDLDVRPGEVLGLIGANGAGKSTLIGVLSGATRPTTGHVEVDGARVDLASPAVARTHGIHTVQQDVARALVPDLTVAENLVLADLAASRRVGWSRRQVGEHAAAVVAATPGGRLDVPLDALAGGLSTSQQQQVLIARALAADPRVLILDEPTAALSVTEQRDLLAEIRRLAGRGLGIVFISHHLAEVTAVCDRVVALRDGSVSGEFSAPFDPPALVRSILGDLAKARRAPAARTGEDDRPVVLSLRRMRAWRGGPPVDLTVRRGEVVGLTGLLGSGKTELLEQIVGARERISGEVALDGNPLVARHPSDAVAAGIGFVPEDRARAAEIPEWDVLQNITLPDLRRRSRWGLLDRGAERAAARRVVDQLAIVASGVDAPLRSLSGGNRQKVMVGRWLAADSRLLILDEPFRGVDLRARGDIAALLRGGVAEGALVASSDPEEILEVADRVLVMAAGAVVGEVDPASVDPDALADLMTADVMTADVMTADVRSGPAADPTPEIA